MAGLPPWLTKGKDNSKGADTPNGKMDPRKAAIAKRLAAKKKGKK